jgi:SEC-C motif domain protein
VVFQPTGEAMTGICGLFDAPTLRALPRADGEPCWCDSGRTVGRCCGPVLCRAATAVTAEALMRSRYSAYVIGDADYLLATWHPDTRPGTLDLEDQRRWLGLTVKAVERGSEADVDGLVEFVARFKVDGRGHRLHERSRFVREQGLWFYRDGVLS